MELVFYSHDKTNEPVSNDKQLEESSKKSLTKSNARDKKKADKQSLPIGLDELWNVAKESKGKKNLKESQVWVDDNLYRKIELLNLKNGKPVPIKHAINAILQMYLDEHKSEIQKALKSR